MTPTAPTGSPGKKPGDEPLPGYRLLEPLGRGGFGEVWKCQAPGGLHKAVKFVEAGGDQFAQESAAFEQIRAVRHAFLLTLERVELVGGELVMVMELADCQLQDRFRASVASGLPGVPRDELLRYMADAAEALDAIAARHGLQHLDVKPANLFLVDGHVKVGDYGLVRRLGGQPGGADPGLTPRYVAPEVLRAEPHARSDQYSLALAYFELLTGAFPYADRTSHQLMLQHLSAVPDLSALPAADRPAVGRALSKDPADRFASCSLFVRALAAAERPRAGESGTISAVPRQTECVPAAPRAGTLSTPQLPRLITVRQPVLLPGVARRPGVVPVAPTRVPPARPALPPVVRVGDLTQRQTAPGDLTVARFVSAVLKAAAPPPVSPVGAAGAMDEPQVCRFLCTSPAALLPLKLAMVAERWQLTPEYPEPGWAVLRRTAYGVAAGAPRGSPLVPVGGLRVVVRRGTRGVGEVKVTAGVYGSPDDTFRWVARLDIPQILDSIRRELENIHERRAHPRFPATFPVQVYSVYPDGVVEGPLGGGCEDVSAGGIRFVTPTPVPTEQMYLEFPGMLPVAGQGLLAGLLRVRPDAGKRYVAVGRFGSDPSRR